MTEQTPSHINNAPPQQTKPAFVVIGTDFGMIFGSTLGAVYGNLVLGMSLGIWLGMMFGGALMASHAEQMAHFVVIDDTASDLPPRK